jgi:hypothetical protein
MINGDIIKSNFTKGIFYEKEKQKRKTVIQETTDREDEWSIIGCRRMGRNI